MEKFIYDRDVTFADIYIVPTNPLEEQLEKKMSPEDSVRLKELSQGMNSDRDQALRHPTTGNQQKALKSLQAYERFVRQSAKFYGIGSRLSRDDVDLTPPRGDLSVTPIMEANMKTVVGRRNAEAIARVGGIAAIPQDKSDEEIAETIHYLRTRHPLYLTPVSISMDTKVHEFRRYLQKRDIDTAVVVDANQRLLGVLSEADLPHGINEDQEVQNFVRTGDVVTAKDGITPLEAVDLMEQEHVHFIPVLNGGDEVVGILTKEHAAMLLRYKPNIEPMHGGLNFMVTVGALNRNPLARVQFLASLGVRNILLDTANFDQGIETYNNLESIREAHPAMNILVGNIVTREAARRCIGAGADGLKTGVGPGYVCKTRVISGAGRPQGSSVFDTAEEAHIYGKYVVADGGLDVLVPGDAGKAIGLGADYIMAGSDFAPVKESPPELHRDDRGFYKEHRGMAEARSSMLRTHGRKDRTPLQKFRDIVGHRSEGVAIKKYQKGDLDSTADVHHAYCEGITAAAGYCDAHTMQELQEKARFGIQTIAGLDEGRPKKD